MPPKPTALCATFHKPLPDTAHQRLTGTTTPAKFAERMKPAPRIIPHFTVVTDPEARHLASMDKTKLYNTEPEFWERARKGYLTWPGGGPELLVLNAEV